MPECRDIDDSWDVWSRADRRYRQGQDPHWTARYLVGTLLLTFCLASPAHSESKRDLFSLPLEELEQMTVTARKREEILQEVPVSVSVVTGALVEQQALENLADVGRYMPNTTLLSSQFTGGQLIASIRGTNFQEVEKTFESSVGVSIDGMFLGTATGASIQLLDIESIEVLRGPQGTLYGRNTIGGTINVRRTLPTGEFGYKLNARVGEHDRQEFGMVLNLPEISDFSTKLYAFSKQADLAAELENNGDEDGQDWLSAGASVLWNASDIFSAQVTFDYVDDSSNYERVYDLTLSTDESIAAGIIPEEIPEITTCDLFGTEHPTTCYSGNFAVQRQDDFETSFGDPRFPFENSMEYWSTIAELNFEISPELSLTSITSYLNLDDKLIEPNVGARPFADGIWDAWYIERDQSYFQFSQEVRVTSDLTGPINFVAGAYYMRTQYDLDGDGPPAVPATATSLASPAPSAFLNGEPASIFRSKQDLDAYAMFGELYFDISEQLRLTTGLRLSYEEKNFFMNRWQQDSTGAIVPKFVFDGNDSWSEPTFRVSVDYTLAENLMGYVSWARGFRSGGYDGRARTLPGVRDTYDPETVDSYELGIRSDLWDRRWRLNPTVFLTKYDDKQEERLVSVDPGNGEVPEVDTITANASEATIWGAELETTVSLTDRLLLRASIGYLDAEFDEFLVPDFDDPLTLEDISDTAELRRVPEWTYNIGADYIQPLAGGSLTASVHHSYTDEYFSSPVRRQRDPLKRDISPDDHRTDFFLTYDFPLGEERGQVTVSAFILDAFGNKVRRATAINAGLFYFGRRVAEKQWGLEFTLAR